MRAVFSAGQLDSLARSPLGKISDWPQSLRTSAQLVLNSPIPMLLLWGEQLTQVYNTAFAENALTVDQATGETHRRHHVSKDGIYRGPQLSAKPSAESPVMS